MIRKDCDPQPSKGHWRTVWGITALSILLPLNPVAESRADTVRMWSSAVVVEGRIRFGDVCAYVGFDAEQSQMLADLVVADAPPAGGSRIIHMDLVRASLSSAGVNLAKVSFRGAVTCAVTRPALPEAPSANGIAGDAASSKNGNPADAAVCPADARPDEEAPLSLYAPETLRDVIVAFLNAEMSRFDGEADVVFDQRDAQLLELSGPAYEFHVRRNRGPVLGLVHLEVDLVSQGRRLQTVGINAKVAMKRHVAVARRAINQGAVARPQDVGLVSMTFQRMDDSGVNDTNLIVGRRAKRFIPQGSLVVPDQFEPVPLVVRGQLVSVASVAGGVTIQAPAKAQSTGMMGDVVTVVSADSKHREMEAVVIGPGQVRVGGRTPGLAVAAVDRGGVQP